MQIYLTRNGTQEGPFSLDHVRASVAQGSLAPTDFAWYEGCPNWIQLSQVPGVFAATPASPAYQPDESVSQVRPWVRYWARMIDISIFSVGTGFILVLIAPAAVSSNGAQNVLGLLLLFLWCFVEPIFLSTWGTTPGKALLAVRLRNADGTILGYGPALSRSFAVWVRGLGLGIPIVSLVTLITAHRTLTTNGITSWDQGKNFHVTHGKIGAIRIIAAVLFFCVFFFLIVLGTIASSPR